MYKAIKNSNSRHKIRDEAIIKTAYYCALRASEISLIKTEDYNIARNEVYCKRLKGSLNNTIRILDKDVIQALKRYIRIYKPEEYLFVSQKGNPISRKSLDVIIKYYCKQANIHDTSKHHFHTLKHTRAVQLAENGLDIKEVQYWLGHKEVSNTLIYFQFTSKQYDALYKKLGKYENYV